MGYWDLVKKIISEADIVAEIIDARFAAQSRNIDMEQMVERAGKKLLIVINKSDMISKREAQRQKEQIPKSCVFVSAKYRKGVARLRVELAKLSAGNQVKIAIVGYPNTGKSSVINMLKGRKAARTSSIAGFTRGKQFVKIASNMMLIDSPGIIPVDEKDETLMVLLSAKNVHHLKDLEGAGIDVAQFLIKNSPDKLRATYQIEARDGEEFLEKLALKRNKLLSGARADLNAAARILIDDFQQGKITLKKPQKQKIEQKMQKEHKKENISH
ncbi:MAG TPA: GTPase [archaeon]|nr:GTPase [archaeon]